VSVFLFSNPKKAKNRGSRIYKIGLYILSPIPKEAEKHGRIKSENKNKKSEKQCLKKGWTSNGSTLKSAKKTDFKGISKKTTAS
jgi:hypothetical protein